MKRVMHATHGRPVRDAFADFNVWPSARSTTKEK
jgi:hypothetical protein